MGIMDPEELENLRGVSIDEWLDPSTTLKKARCNSCGEISTDEEVEWDNDANNICPHCHSTDLTPLKED